MALVSTALTLVQVDRPVLAPPAHRARAHLVQLPRKIRALTPVGWLVALELFVITE